MCVFEMSTLMADFTNVSFLWLKKCLQAVQGFPVYNLALEMVQGRVA